MNKKLTVGLVLATVVGGFLLYLSFDKPEIEREFVVVKQQQPKVKAHQIYPSEITELPIVQSANRLHAESTSAEEDLSLVQSLLHSHRRALGVNPVGLNDEITAALTGKNLKGAASLSASHPAISKNGELLDRWGTPYRFHSVSAKLMEVRSAGQDKKYFTKDDISLLE